MKTIITNNALTKSAAFAVIESTYQPELILQIVKGDHPHGISVVAYNTTDTPVSLENATVNVFFMKAESLIAV